MKRAAIAIAMLAAAFAAQPARADVRQAVAASLSAAGLHEGVNGDGTIVAVGTAKRRLHGSDAPSAQVRDICHKIASVEARAEILRTIGSRVSAGRAAAFRHDGVDAKRELAEVCGTMAERVLSGWRIVDAAEAVDGGVYSVAVAVAWSEDAEERISAAMSKKIFPAAGWRGELERHLDSAGVAGWRFERVFVDSAGFPHVMGVGVADWDGNPDTKRARSSMAVAMAKKNLLLALYGDSYVRERAAKESRRMRAAGERTSDAASFYASLADIGVSKPLPAGTRDLRLAVVPGPGGRESAIVSVFGYEPEPPPAAAPQRAVSRSVPSPAGVKVFNPSTGKFENRKGEKK